MVRRTLGLAVLLASVLALAFVVAPAALAGESAVPRPAVPEVESAGTVCATLDLESLLGVEAGAANQCAESQPEAGVPEAAWLAPQRAFKTCKCSCGQRCQTSADCGGAACVAGISCC